MLLTSVPAMMEWGLHGAPLARPIGRYLRDAKMMESLREPHAA